MKSAEFLGESDEKPFRPENAAEPVRVFVPDYFAGSMKAAWFKDPDGNILSPVTPAGTPAEQIHQ